MGWSPRGQLIALGLTRDAIDGRVARCVLLPLYRGVYALGHKALSIRGRWMAAVLAGGPDAVLSHRDAAALWGVRRVSGTRIDVTAPKRSRAPRGITLHRAKLAPEDRTTRDNISTTRLARTFLDLAALSRLDAVVRALEEAERLRLIDMRQVDATLQRANGHPGSGKLTQAIKAYEPRHLRTRSDLERAFVQLCANAGLPKPQVNARLGAYEVDALWPEQRLIVELDAYRTHGSRRSFENDRIRDATLLAAGYRTLRVTGLRLEREPGAVGRAIARLLA